MCFVYHSASRFVGARASSSVLWRDSEKLDKQIRHTLLDRSFSLLYDLVSWIPVWIARWIYYNLIYSGFIIVQFILSNKFV